ncbi:CopG family transcriptional regulator [Sphingomonas sp. Leaf343]|uniref:ribbon-helix-helix domain-containing protein n=1 Tax=Sphingomonas sp. Leaf343 TaxID=1736345 RepID=UPI0006FB6916|nr:CopG family transcriptional regulator [Sphingomonas sp. Leaf343]KQR80926.1 CopG family transcriptional regulator [Sphingomonas sp. Leaf343]
MRTLVTIPDEDIAALDELAQRNGRSRAAELRVAVSQHLRDRSNNDWISRGAGYWKHRQDVGDAVEYQRAMREDRDGF